ncbi:MAG TPA: ABC transporter ATP-binding protein [Candidatus Binatia bacterium]|nr:ABC transporter ATP-binding protein [Candidatus Binatia bacterium]
MAAAAGRNLIAARGLGKSFGGLSVLRDVDLDVATGEVVAVLGPNGGGKSTLLKILAGVMRAGTGRLEVLGEELFPGRPSPAVLRRLGYVGHDALVYRDLSPRENLEFFARAYGRSPAEAAAAATAALERCRLTAAAERPTHVLSRGMLQRLAIARATLHEPDLLLLDEPFSGLDPAAAGDLDRVLAARRDEGRATVLVTHDVALVPRLATRAVLVAGGRARDLGPTPDPDVLAAAYRDAAGGRRRHGDAGQLGDVGDRP